MQFLKKLPKRRMAALLLAVALVRGPANAGLPVFDGLNWVEGYLAKIEAWVQTAQMIANGDYLSAALYGTAGLTGMQTLTKAREALGRGMSIAARADNLYRNVNRLKNNRPLQRAGQQFWGDATSLNYWAIGENWSWGERQNGTKLDSVWDRLMDKRAALLDRLDSLAQKRKEEAEANSPCTGPESGTLNCAEASKHRTLLKAENMLRRMRADRIACAEAAGVTGLQRLAELADNSETAGIGDAKELPVLGTSTDAATATPTQQDANYRYSSDGVQVSILTALQGQEQRDITDMRTKMALAECRAQIPDQDIEDLERQVADLEAAIAEADAARRDFVSHALAQASMYCQGDSMAYSGALAYGGPARAEDYFQTCLQQQIDRVWDTSNQSSPLYSWPSGYAKPEKPDVSQL